MSYCSSLEPQKTQISSLVIGISFLGIYLLFCYFLVGLRPDHIKFISFLFLMLITSKYTRSMVFGMSFFIIYWIIYDSLRIFPNFMFNEVSTDGLYHLEKSIFGIIDNGALLTPNEYFQNHQTTVSNILSGIFYLCWVPIPLAISAYLFLIKKDYPKLLEFSFVFLLINLIGFVLYYIFPAAPPWYIAKHGFVVDFKVMGDPGNFINFDRYFGINLFETMYAKNANVFAAVPSLHAAYPVVATYYSVKYRFKFFAILSFIVTLGISFSAVYSLHHYMIDVLLGISCAIIGILTYERVLMKTRINQFLEKYANFIQNQATKIED